ncbi:MAG: hypothetical protein KatS3mg111_2304 [Pirellulaceae bacterium]|nr:MAG: hypothetical protein KatS3mg111_2304 [Pirellulaceae bacterium]
MVSGCIPIAVEHLQVHSEIGYDLVDAKGLLLLKAGEKISPALISQFNRRGVRTVYLRRVAGATAAEAPQGTEEGAFSAASIGNRLFSGVAALSNQLVSGKIVSTEALVQSFETVDRHCQADRFTVLADAISSSNAHEGSPHHRGMRSAMISSAVALEMDLDSRARQLLFGAALMSDISLQMPRFVELRDQELRSVEQEHELRELYRQHPESSARLLETRMPDADPTMLTIIRQSHELCDGSGFPRGLRRHLLHPLSRIVVVVDAFVRLTETDSAGENIGLVPADALAYLVLHALYGVFDLEVVKALVATTAAYPVGTAVKLDDQRQATVVRSQGKHYLDPVVRIDGQTDLVDLRRAGIRIEAPLTAKSWRRLPKSLMNRRLWEPAFAPSSL